MMMMVTTTMTKMARRTKVTLIKEVKQFVIMKKRKIQNIRGNQVTKVKVFDMAFVPHSNIQELESTWTELADWRVDPECVTTYNIVLFGPTGAGKSGFINSVLSEFCQRIITKAFTGAHDGGIPTTTNVSPRSTNYNNVST